MNEREYQSVKKRVLRLSKFWKDRLLPQWRLDLVFVKEALNSNSTASDHGMETVMTIERSWSYKRAQVKIDANIIAKEKLSDEDLEDHFVHELCHALVHQMRSIVAEKCPNCGSDRTYADHDMEHEEAVVTNMAIAITGIKRSSQRLH